MRLYRALRVWCSGVRLPSARVLMGRYAGMGLRAHAHTIGYVLT